MTLQRLYKTSVKGATQIIDMTISGDTYTRSWGQLDGKMQTKATTAKGKNIGRANETTPEQQAIIEAEAVWTKKQKANYSTSVDAPVTVNLPMKVNDYHKHKKKVIFPCFVSVKLNGVNAEYRLVEGVLKLLSRGGEEYPIPPHQRDDAINLMKHLGTTSLNGEMYIHGEYLQDIMAATKKHNDLTPKLKFWVFDFPELEGDYNTRCTYAYSKISGGAFHGPSTPFIQVGVSNSHEELDDSHKIATDAGYEGIIIRNAKGSYSYNTRSLDVFKYKVAMDGEFKTIDFNLDKNGHIVFVCAVRLPRMDDHLPDIPTFKVKLKGTAEERLAMAAEADNYLGKFLKVEYEMLSKDGIPQKPVGQHFRKCDSHGNPLE